MAWKPGKERTGAARGKGELNPEPFLKAFRAFREEGPENRGELRLVAWCDRVMPGQKIEPAVDRQRGFTAVVVHLRMGPPPAPDGPTYNRLAQEHPNRPVEGANPPVAQPPPPLPKRARRPGRVSAKGNPGVARPASP